MYVPVPVPVSVSVSVSVSVAIFVRGAVINVKSCLVSTART